MPDPDDSGFAAAEREHLSEPEDRETEAEADRDERQFEERYITPEWEAETQRIRAKVKEDMGW